MNCCAEAKRIDRTSLFRLVQAQMDEWACDAYRRLLDEIEKPFAHAEIVAYKEGLQKLRKQPFKTNCDFVCFLLTDCHVDKKFLERLRTEVRALQRNASDEFRQTALAFGDSLPQSLRYWFDLALQRWYAPKCGCSCPGSVSPRGNPFFACECCTPAKLYELLTGSRVDLSDQVAQGRGLSELGEARRCCKELDIKRLKEEREDRELLRSAVEHAFRWEELSRPKDTFPEEKRHRLKEILRKMPRPLASKEALAEGMLDKYRLEFSKSELAALWAYKQYVDAVPPPANETKKPPGGTEGQG